MPSGGFTDRSQVLWKNAWPGHYPKGSAVSKIGSYFLKALLRVSFQMNGVETTATLFLIKLETVL